MASAANVSQSAEGNRSFLSQIAFLAGRTMSLPPSVILSSAVINMLALALPLVILQIYDRVLPLQSTDTLLALVAMLLTVTAIEAMLSLARGYLIEQHSLKATYNARQKATHALLYGPWASIASAKPDLWQRRLSAVDEYTGSGKAVDQTVLIDLPYVVLFMGLMWVVGGVLVLVPIAVMVAFLLLTVLSSRAYRDALDRRAKDEASRYTFISEILRGITTVKIMGAEPFLLRRVEEHAEPAARNSYRLILEANQLLTLAQMFASVTLIMVVTAGAYLVIDRDISVGTLACCTLLTTRTTQPVLRTFGAWTNLQGASLVRQRAREILRLGAPAVMQHSASAGGEIELSNIDFEPTPGQDIFSGLSLRVETGQIVGITGESGSGKSLLLSMIAGRCRPTSGRVTINGVDIAARDGEAQLGNVCLLGASPAIFQGSVLDNITLGRGGDAVHRAALAMSLIGVDDRIKRLPEGIETKLGDSTTDILPRRIIQGIVLARALIVPARIILIDGASAYFTHESQARFRAAVQEIAAGTTFVFTDHRAGKLTFADKLFVIEDGRLEAASQDGANGRG